MGVPETLLANSLTHRSYNGSSNVTYVQQPSPNRARPNYVYILSG
jgi:hypothetical protein